MMKLNQVKVLICFGVMFLIVGCDGTSTENAESVEAKIQELNEDFNSDETQNVLSLTSAVFPAATPWIALAGSLLGGFDQMRRKKSAQNSFKETVIGLGMVSDPEQIAKLKASQSIGTKLKVKQIKDSNAIT